MKRLGVASLLFLTLPFCHSCNKPQYNVYVACEHCSWSIKPLKATKGEPLFITFSPEKFYEVYEENILVNDIGFTMGVWKYTQSNRTLEISKEMITQDIHINVEIAQGNYNVYVHPNGWQIDKDLEEGKDYAIIPVDHDVVTPIFTVLDPTFKKENVTEPEGLDFELIPVDNTQKFKINAEEYYRDITIKFSNKL